MDRETVRKFIERLKDFERHGIWQLKADSNCCGITLAQCHIILEIGRRGETSLGDLALSIGLDKSTLSRHINGMVNKGLAKRETDKKDRRYVIITLTDKGRELLQSIEEMRASRYERILKLIPEDRLTLVLESLDMFLDALSLNGVEKDLPEGDTMDDKEVARNDIQ